MKDRFSLFVAAVLALGGLALVGCETDTDAVDIDTNGDDRANGIEESRPIRRTGFFGTGRAKLDDTRPSRYRN